VAQVILWLDITELAQADQGVHGCSSVIAGVGGHKRKIDAPQTDYTQCVLDYVLSSPQRSFRDSSSTPATD
jgi:hypothetical protein